MTKHILPSSSFVLCNHGDLCGLRLCLLRPEDLLLDPPPPALLREARGQRQQRTHHQRRPHRGQSLFIKYNILDSRSRTTALGMGCSVEARGSGSGLADEDEDVLPTLVQQHWHPRLAVLVGWSDCLYPTRGVAMRHIVAGSCLLNIDLVSATHFYANFLWISGSDLVSRYLLPTLTRQHTKMDLNSWLIDSRDYGEKIFCSSINHICPGIFM